MVTNGTSDRQQSWIERINELEEEISPFQQTPARSDEIGFALYNLKMARFWIQEDQQMTAINPGILGQKP